MAPKKKAAKPKVHITDSCLRDAALVRVTAETAALSRLGPAIGCQGKAEGCRTNWRC